MQVAWKQRKQELIFTFSPDDDDPSGEIATPTGKKFALNKNECKFIMPEGWTKESVHPDMLALAAALMVEPFTTSTIELPIAVSEDFADLYYRLRNIKLAPVDKNITARQPAANGRAGLCFSGGIDSTAAAIVMPKDTVLVFASRIMPEKRAGLYDIDAALHACENMSSLGHTVVQVETDYEFLRQPIGFATNYSSAVPLVLLADYLNINSMAFGMVLESAFAIGDVEFREPNSTQYQLLKSCGLPLNLVTSGLSEVATSKIVNSHPEYATAAQSCVRGKAGAPCLECMKCFRKQLLERALSRSSFSDIKISQKIQNKEIYKTLTKSPLHHEGVYVYIYNNGQISGLGHRLFRRKVRSHKIDNTWLERWYSPSASTFSDFARDYQVKQIKQELEVMSDQDEQLLRSWNPARFSDAIFYKLWSKLFVSYAEASKRSNRKA